MGSDEFYYLELYILSPRLDHHVVLKREEKKYFQM